MYSIKLEISDEIFFDVCFVSRIREIHVKNKIQRNNPPSKCDAKLGPKTL
jgi:hypothetical protein